MIPTLIPAEQLTISYLYEPALTFDLVNQGIKCDQGFAHTFPVIVRRQFPRWLTLLGNILLLVGVGTAAYFLYRIGRCAILSCTGIQ